MQELKNANASFLQKHLCTCGGKTKLKDSKHVLPAPNFGMENFFKPKVYISARSKVDD